MSDLACSTRTRFHSTEARRLIVALPYFNDTQSVGGVVMAQRTMTVCDIDDLRGDTVVTTAAVRLDLAGEVHQLDVCAAHLDELRAALTAVLPSPPVSRRGGRPRTTATGRQQSRQPAGRSSRGRRTTTSRSATLAAASPDSGGAAASVADLDVVVRRPR